MLGKIIKYDLKASSRLFILMHAIYILICLAVRFLYMDRLDLFDSSDQLFISLALFLILLVTIVCALSIFTWIQITVRFYRNLFSKEGYLSWTLPVSGVQHLWGKIISGFILMAVDATVIYGGIVLMFTGETVTSAYSLIAADVTQELGMPLGMFSFFIYLATVASCIGSVVMLYFCIVVGQLFPGHRVLCAIAAYFITTFVIQILSMILMILLGCFPGYDFYQAQGETMKDYMFTILISSTALMIVIAVIQYFAAHYIMKKKINLL